MLAKVWKTSATTSKKLSGMKPSNNKSAVHLIAGTAGHIDHGKTALIKALTGIDCDTHKEEQVRGITINLGFAHLDFEDGSSIGIVDVPGHKDFIHTMISGAVGIDIAILVIAANEGIMPQTYEHLKIMETLGVKYGLVVLNKIDLVDDDVLQIAEIEIQEFLEGTFLDQAQIIKVSAEKGLGIEELKSRINTLIHKVESRKCGKIPRLYIDRIFSAAGFGSVVTGSLLSGSIRKNDTVFLLPPEKELKVKRIEKHGTEADEVTAGDRISLNLAGLEKSDFKRGMVLCGKVLASTKMIDAKINLFKGSKKLLRWTNVILFLGTFQTQARVNILDQDSIEPGKEALAQLHLNDHCIAMKGDKFIIRSTSGEMTLGGGEILDAHPLHHKRRKEKVIADLKSIALGNKHDFIAVELKKIIGSVNALYLADLLNTTENEIIKLAKEYLSNETALIDVNGSYFLIMKSQKEKIIFEIMKNLISFHKSNPLYAGGKSLSELSAVIGKKITGVSDNIIKSILEELIIEGKIKKVNSTYALANHKPTLTEEEKKQINFILSYLKSMGMQTPLLSEMRISAYKRGIDEIKLKQILQYLCRHCSVYSIDGNFLHKSVVDYAREKLIKYLSESGKGITVAGFRDLINGNRKICLLLLNLFDTEGVTIRIGDERYLNS